MACQPLIRSPLGPTEPQVSPPQTRRPPVGPRPKRRSPTTRRKRRSLPRPPRTTIRREAMPRWHLRDQRRPCSRFQKAQLHLRCFSKSKPADHLPVSPCQAPRQAPRHRLSRATRRGRIHRRTRPARTKKMATGSARTRRLRRADSREIRATMEIRATHGTVAQDGGVSSTT